MQMTISNRPQYFDDLQGQSSIVKEMNARKLSHNWPQAMLLKGMTGTGKTSTAQIIAMTLNCKSPETNGNPCLKCSSCLSIIEERFDRDTHQLDGSGSSKGELLDFGALSGISPMYDQNAIFIIEESDQLSLSAKNSLLKILERPRPNVYFILLSMVNTGLPPAIQSRCQTFNFRAFNTKDIMLGLKNILVNNNLWAIPTIPKEFYLHGLVTIAETSSGSFRTAIQILEKCLIGEYWTPELIRQNLGVVDVTTAYIALDKLLALDASFFNDLNSVDINEFFGITYLILSQAASYKFTKIAPNEYFEAQTQAISQNRNLFDLLNVYDDLQTFPYLKKALLISKFSKYFASKKIRKIEE